MKSQFKKVTSIDDLMSNFVKRDFEFSIISRNDDLVFYCILGNREFFIEVNDIQGLKDLWNIVETYY